MKLVSEKLDMKENIFYRAIRREIKIDEVILVLTYWSKIKYLAIPSILLLFSPFLLFFFNFRLFISGSSSSSILLSPLSSFSSSFLIFFNFF